MCQVPREPEIVGGTGIIQRPSCHTAGLEDSLGCAYQAMEAQRKPPRSAGATEGALQNGVIEAGF